MFTVNELLDFLEEKKYIEERIKPIDDSMKIESFSSLTNSKDGSLCWTKRIIKEDEIPSCAVLLCLPEQKGKAELRTLLVHVAEPRKAFADVVSKFCSTDRDFGVSPSAKVHSSAELSEKVYVGDNSVIGENCEIGDYTIIDANVTLYKGVKIGANCRIASGTVIGADGFGYFLDENKRYKKILHLGGVTIGNNVEIGANCCVDRGVLDDTIIENNVKTDNMVQIAHNNQIGENSVIAAGAILAGSVKIGTSCWIAPGAVIRNGVILKDEVQVGMNSVVYRSYSESNVCLVGDPAKKLKKYEAK